MEPIDIIVVITFIALIVAATYSRIIEHFKK